MQQAFLEISGVRTCVVTYGKWVEESSNSSEPEDLILLIPGNPGVTGFYKMFMHILHEKTGYPVWIVGHAGHEIPKNNTISPIPPLKGNEKIFGLQGQVDHKREFIEKYVPENARLHLVGHSIGCYTILELMKSESIKSKVVDVNLLFPTIEEMAVTSNGKFMTTFVKPVLWLIIFLSLIFTILPSILRNFLMYLYMKITCTPRMHFRTLLNFIHPSVLEKVFFMAYEELDQVKARDNEVILQNLKKIRFLYGATDGWAPEAYCNKLKKDIEGANVELCTLDHAFVMKSSREVGNMVAEWIGNK